MKLTNIILIFLFVLNIQLFSQTSSLDTWSIGTGISNFNMKGDLTSSSPNLGFYIYLNKMITPAFGFEIKTQILNMEGSSNDTFAEFPNSEKLKFEGDSFGGELNLVINFNGFFSNPPEKKLNFASYFGIGYHNYSTKLLDANTNEVLVNFNSFSDINGGKPRSIYYSTGLGLKYKFSERINFELRQSFNFNNEDHLDATISSNKSLEIFNTTQLGVVINLYRGKKVKVKKITKTDDVDDTSNLNIEEIVAKKLELYLIDSDGDSVIDLFDKEPNTDKNAIVYADGVAIDSDKDGVPDHLDKCPLIAGDGEDGCNDIVVTSTIVDVDQPKIITNQKIISVSRDNVEYTIGESDYRREKSVIDGIISNAKKGITEEIVVVTKPEKIDPRNVSNPNYEVIKKLNEKSIKHNIFELDNSVNLSSIEIAPIYPGCNDNETEQEKRNCLINKISTFALSNFNASQFSGLGLNKGTNLIRVIFVVDVNGKSKVYKTIGKWDDKIKQEANRVIQSLPTLTPGQLKGLPTPVKFSIEIPFNVK